MHQEFRELMKNATGVSEHIITVLIALVDFTVLIDPDGKQHLIIRPFIRIDPFFICFMIGFITSSIFTLTLAVIVPRWYPPKRQEAK